MTDNKDYTRRNRFTGESVELTPEEAKKHDDKSRYGTSKKGVAYYVYYDMDAHGYRTATTSWKVRH